MSPGTQASINQSHVCIILTTLSSPTTHTHTRITPPSYSFTQDLYIIQTHSQTDRHTHTHTQTNTDSETQTHTHLSMYLHLVRSTHLQPYPASPSHHFP